MLLDIFLINEVRLYILICYNGMLNLTNTYDKRENETNLKDENSLLSFTAFTKIMCLFKSNK